MTIFLLKIYSRWRRLLVAIRNHWPLHRLRWPRNRSRRTEPLKRNRWWRRPKDRPRKARADRPFTIRPTTTCLPKRTRPFWYILYLDLNAAPFDCHSILFSVAHFGKEIEKQSVGQSGRGWRRSGRSVRWRCRHPNLFARLLRYALCHHVNLLSLSLSARRPISKLAKVIHHDNMWRNSVVILLYDKHRILVVVFFFFCYIFCFHVIN